MHQDIQLRMRIRIMSWLLVTCKSCGMLRISFLCILCPFLCSFFSNFSLLLPCRWIFHYWFPKFITREDPFYFISHLEGRWKVFSTPHFYSPIFLFINVFVIQENWSHQNCQWRGDLVHWYIHERTSYLSKNFAKP